MSRGTPNLLTCWIPYGDVPLEVGGLMVMERSHLQSARIKNYLNLDVDRYCENRPAEVDAAREGKWTHNGWLSERSDTLPFKFNTRWLTVPEWRMGDFLTFNMTMIHGSLDNQTDRIRLSSDTRYQRASEPADERWIGPKPIGHSAAGKRGRIC
jgi:ectoine hydroxylase-related dioxygenase (phytanoyl-CoA dioxygenase family)